MSRPWYSKLTDKLQDKLCKYAVQLYLGEYLVDEVSLDQLRVDLYSGTGTIHSLQINTKTVNELLDKHGIPLQLVEGFIKTLTISIPWNALISNDSAVEIHGLELTFQPKPGATTTNGDLDASWLSQSHMATSMHIAEECLKDEPPTQSLPDSLSSFAKTIESVLTRVRVTLVDTVVRLESCPIDAMQGIALELCIGRIAYFDEVAASDTGSSVDGEPDSGYAAKNFHITGGISLYTDLFVPCHRSRSASSGHAPDVSMTSTMTSTMSSDIFASALSSHSPIMRQPSYISASRSAEGLPQERTTLNSEPVKFFTALGEQIIKLEIKKDDEAPGNKFNIEIQLSSVGIMLMPKQVHLLVALVNAFTGEKELPSALQSPSRLSSLGSEPFFHPDNDLQHMQPGKPILDLGQLDLDQLRIGEIDNLSVDSGMFQSIHGHSSGMSDVMTTSMYSGYSDQTTLLSNTATPSTFQYGSGAAHKRFGAQQKSASNKQQKPREHKDQVTSLKGNLGLVVFVLLNEDTITKPTDALDSGESDMEKLHKKSEVFFDGFSTYGTNRMADLLFLRDEIQNFCSDNHLKLIAKRVELDVEHGSQKGGRKKKSSLRVDANISECEVTEFIRPDDMLKSILPIAQQSTSEILTFSKGASDTSSLSQPSVRVNFTSTTAEKAGDLTTQSSKISVKICRECTVEVDISITDRLNDLLNPSATFGRQPNLNTSDMSATSSPLRERDLPTFIQTTDVEIESLSVVTVYLRFPIADLHDEPNRRFQWWRRNLRQEVLELELTMPKFVTSFPSSKNVSEMEFTCRSVQAFFVMGGHEGRVAFANIGQDHGEHPRLLVRSHPVRLASLLEEDEADSFDSIKDYCDLPPIDVSPFSGRRELFSRNEQLKIPGSRTDMADFEQHTKSNTELFIQLDLPAVNVVVPNKNTLEVLYNRLCNDLLLWEPLAPVPTPTNTSCSTTRLGISDNDLRPNYPFSLNAGHLLSFQQIGADADADPDDISDDPADSMTYSIYESSKYSRRRRVPTVASNGQSKTCVMIGIKRGRLTLVHPTLGATKSVIPGHHGQTVLDLQDGVIYVNSKSMGDPNLGYISIHSSQCALYHDGCISGGYIHPRHVERLQTTAPSLPLTLALCPSSVPTKLPFTVGSKGDEDMLGVAIKITQDPRKQIKNILVSAVLRNACLHHVMVNTPHMWLFQLMDLLALDDYDVLGYAFPKVSTELHFHVLSSAVSYVPRHLPYAGLLVLEKFSISSNVVVSSLQTALKFLVEDAALYLSDAKDRQALRLQDDYVCLLELDHFQLDWKSAEGHNPKYAKTDITADCTTLHVRTCADSLMALQKLIVYLAEDGDLAPSDTTEEGDEEPLDQSLKTTASPEDETALCGLMQDAMMEKTPSRASEPRERTHVPTDAFAYDPDYGTTPSNSDNSDVEDSDDDFCMIDYPNIPTEDDAMEEALSGDAIIVRDSTTVIPVTNVDLLLPPKGFPDAVLRYCLPKLTIVWDMYGGRDFGRKVAGNSGRSSWGTPRSRGGVARDYTKLIQLQLSKVQMHWEVYSEDSTKVSRRCLLIDEIEIVDEITASGINKMLYHNSTVKRPKQMHTGMVILKVVTFRPDIAYTDRHESDLMLSVQPIRVNMDQNALIFLWKFFTDLSTDSDDMASGPISYNADDETVNLGRAAKKPEYPSTEKPIMTMSYSAKNAKEEGRAMFDEIAGDEVETKPKTIVKPSPQFFIRSFVFSPSVSILVDYVGRHIDVEQRLQGILLGLTQLNKAEIKLMYMHCRGVLGVEKLAEVCVENWKKDIVRNQIPSIIGGVGPLNSFVQLYQGVHNLLWMPVQQYRRDGRIVRGLQQGANSFSSSSSIALLELTNRAVQAIQGLAEISYSFVSPESLPLERRRREPPRDVYEGITNAGTVIYKGVVHTASNVYNSAAQEKEAKGMAGFAGYCARVLPGAALTPFIIAPEAASSVLDGIRNHLHPEARREDINKWKT